MGFDFHDTPSIKPGFHARGQLTPQREIRKTKSGIDGGGASCQKRGARPWLARRKSTHQPAASLTMIHETTQAPSGRPAMAAYDFNERPFLVFWEITRACALACSHCRAEAQARRHPDELDAAEAKHLIGQLAELAPPMLILTGGDPLMRRDAMDLVREATAAGLHVGLSPSATERVMRADFAEIKAAGVKRMSLSLDGATRETHDAFRGVGGTFDRTIEAVHRSHAAGLDLQINTTLTRGNLNEFEAFKNLMFELKPAMWSVFLLVPTGRAGLADLPDAADIERVFEEMAELVGKAPFAVKTTEGHHFRRVLMQKMGAQGRAMQGMRSPQGIRDGRGVMFISHTGVVSPQRFPAHRLRQRTQPPPGRNLPPQPALHGPARQRRPRR